MIEHRHPSIDGDFEIRDAEKQVGGRATRGSRRRRAPQVRALAMGIEAGHRIGILVEPHVLRVFHAALRELRVERRRREPDRGAVAIDEPFHAQLNGVVCRGTWIRLRFGIRIDRPGRAGGGDGDTRHEGDDQQAAQHPLMSDRSGLPIRYELGSHGPRCDWLAPSICKADIV